MKTGKNIFWAFGMAMAIFAASRVQAQFMPVVYDRSYGKEIHYEQVCPDFSNGDVVAVGENGGHPMVIWLNRLGESILSRKFPAGDFAKITNVFPLAGRQSAAGRAAARFRRATTGVPRDAPSS